MTNVVRFPRPLPGELLDITVENTKYKVVIIKHLGHNKYHCRIVEGPMKGYTTTVLITEFGGKSLV